MRLGKLLTLLFLAGIIGWVIYGIVGQTDSSTSGRAYYVFEDGREIPVKKLPDCMDSDGGKNYFLDGTAYNGREQLYYTDYCENEEKLVEYFCNNNLPDRIMIPCDCFLGACRS